MLMDEACISCIVNQSKKVANAIGADEQLSKELYESVLELSCNFSKTQTPPQIASYVYAKMSKIANKYDLYDKVKEASTKKALSFVPLLQKKLQASEDVLLTATKIAVAGNVIDLAAEVEFDLEDELKVVFDTPFGVDDFAKLKDELSRAKKVLIIGDNVGEHIFDRMFIEILQKLNPQSEFFYMTRGKPIINDVTIKEAKEAKIDEICTLVDSGVDTPGFDYARATKGAKELFDSADVVISKGMGNYESLSPSHRQNICFLLKVKCTVVASSLGKNIGDIICKMV